MKHTLLSVCTLLLSIASALAQDYFLEKYQPFQSDLPSPETFLGYGIGEQHTRHDLIVAYLKALAAMSDRAEIEEYGQTYEGRSLVMLRISTPQHLENLETMRQEHLSHLSGKGDAKDLPAFIQLGYNVHGNEPSSAEAALLTAYTLVASEHPEVKKYRQNAVIFIDPAINPDGRDRHTHWANSFKGSPLVADPQDMEHNEAWPGGRTNHYWFDLNRDWLLAIHPESRGKLNWYHHWYPNVVTDFHEMGTQSTYFFEPMKAIGSKDPIMPEENYGKLNDLFGNYFAAALDSIGSLYFTREAFDGTYPGYGSSYPDLQGGLGLLFEQASSRGHVQETPMGKITFPFTIRNQYTSSLTTVKAAVENKAYLRDYQQRFFSSATDKAVKSGIRGYRFTIENDHNRLKAFIDKLLIHRIEVYRGDENEFIVPTAQPQYRMVQTIFETYDQYRDSVFYDASAWSLANFYNAEYQPVRGKLKTGEKITDTGMIETPSVPSLTSYAYLVDWRDYQSGAFLNYLSEQKLRVQVATKGFTGTVSRSPMTFTPGTLVIPVSRQDGSPEAVFEVIREAADKFKVPVYSVGTGYHQGLGVDLGSNSVVPITPPKPFMLVGNGVNPYEAGEVWHLLDQRVHMPITKIPMRNFSRAEIAKYNTMVMVSGSYAALDSNQIARIRDWVTKGNTLITSGTAVKWAIESGLAEAALTEAPAKDTTVQVSRLPYADRSENRGKKRVGGAIFKTDLDLTHPIAFGYSERQIPVYKNNEVWLAPSKNPYNTIAKYTEDPHIDGFISEENLEHFLKPSASVVASKLGKGRVILFADNPNFRGSWYGTNKLFLNALFFGSLIQNP